MISFEHILRNQLLRAGAGAIVLAALLGAQWADLSRARSDGEERVLSIRPIDPRDLFFGHYVAIGYRDPIADLPGGPPPRRYYADQQAALAFEKAMRAGDRDSMRIVLSVAEGRQPVIKALIVDGVRYDETLFGLRAANAALPESRRSRP